MKMNVNNLVRKGNNIFEDRSGRIYLKSKMNNCVYLIEKDKLKQFSFFQSRFMVPVVILIVIGFYFNWIAAVIISLISYIVLEFVYNFYFLRQLVTMDISILPQDLPKENRYLTFSKKSNILRMLISVLFTIALWINYFISIPNWWHLSSYSIENAENIFLLIATLFCTVLAVKIFISVFKTLIKQRK